MPSPPSGTPGKKKNAKPVPKWQSWENNALDRRFRMIGVAFAVIGGMSVIAIGVLVWQSHKQNPGGPGSLRATVINARAPEMLAPFTCDLRGGFHSGAIRAFFKNMGTGDAKNMTEFFSMRIVPEKKIGNAEFDQIPNGNCGDKALQGRNVGILAAGKDSSTELPPPSVAVPPLLSGEGAQLYGVSCAYFSDASGNDHASCETYRFKPDNGGAAFMCDATPKQGKFVEPSVLGCAN